MPPKRSEPEKPLEQIVEEVGLYPIEAYIFVQKGLQYTVQKLRRQSTDSTAKRHVTGRELSEGLREYALLQWGRLARLVLRRWNITRTEDFGRIVYALVESGYMTTSEEDTIDHFRNVYSFAQAFEDGYTFSTSPPNSDRK